VAELQNAITQFQKLLQGAQRRHPVYRQQLVQCYQLLVMYAPDPGPLYAEALPVARSLVDDNAVVEEYCIPLADLLLNYAGYLLVNMREPELLEVHAEIERLLEPISKKSTSACDLAASNQFYWASRFASDPATAREHLLRAQAYWQQFKKLGGDASFANAELAKVEAELAKTSAPPSVEEASR
jgi:hypothetical protein